MARFGWESERMVRNNTLTAKLLNTSKDRISLYTSYAYFTTRHLYHANKSSKTICWIILYLTFAICCKVHLILSDMGVWELLTTLYPGYASHSGPVAWQLLADILIQLRSESDPDLEIKYRRLKTKQGFYLSRSLGFQDRGCPKEIFPAFLSV